MFLYYITDRRQLASDDHRQRERLLEKIAEAARCGIDCIQLRERDLPARALESLARQAVQVLHQVSSVEVSGTERPRAHRTRLLINSRIDIALAVGADGVHLRSDDLAPSEARVIWEKARTLARPTNSSRIEPPAQEFVIVVSCHTAAEVRLAEAHGADFAVFAPVFKKVMHPQRQGVGLEALRAACQSEHAPPNVEGVAAGRMSVLALGGVTMENARACVEAGAAGVAGIRLFQEHDIDEIVEQLRALTPPADQRAAFRS